MIVQLHNGIKPYYIGVDERAGLGGILDKGLGEVMGL